MKRAPHAGGEVRERVLAAGSQEYLAKPIEPAALAAAIKNLAGRGGRQPRGA